MSNTGTCKEEEMQTILQNESINEMDDEESMMTTNKEIDINKKHQKYLAYGVLGVLCLIILIIVAIIGVDKIEKSASNTSSNTKTKDLVNIIMEDPVHCLMDENCTSFAFNDTEISRIRQTFNQYDGNNDDLWTKQEFISFYIESNTNGGGNEFNYMDFNGDGILSYKEAVIYFMELSEISLIKDMAFPIFKQTVEEIYGYNTTIYKDQLFWEYVVELMFITLDIYQQGFITENDYYSNLAQLEFKTFANDADTITFEEFFHSRFSQQDLDEFVNTDINLMSAEYKELGISLNSTQAHLVLSQFKLQHCLYSGIDSEHIRRLLATRSDCYWAIAGCAGASGATVAGCILSWPSGPLGWTACFSGTVATAAGCRSALQICEEWYNNK